MTKTKSTKHALIMSVMALFLCFTMLLGTTFAWFTDSVTSANNIIKSGNLDITLEYFDIEADAWKDVKDSADILTGDLWEPGYTDVAYLRIKNNGSLALKYALSVNIISEKSGVNKDGETFSLSDYIYFDVVDGKQPAFADRAEAMAAVDSATKIARGYSRSGSLAADSDYVYLAMVVYMPTTVGNVANHNGVDVPEINLGINVFATQDTVESDSFGTDYDADNSVDTVDAANVMLAANKDVTLMGCNEADGILNVPSGYTGTLTLVNSSIKSVQAAGDVNIVILGRVVVDANGSGVATASESGSSFDGSAITAKGVLNISGSGTLTAIAADVKGASGIGGMNTTEINIKDVTIERAEGSYAYGVGTDTKYYKDAPEGGAAIGSGLNGAVITLDNVTVINAIGGSKAAGIGARYHVGVSVNITDSAIAYVEGGVSAAGVGGSRVSSGATESGTTINITNSTITAKGGAYGAGIGSGYDTHCLSVQPMCTINIADSTINAEGGQYAAGVGTGYHNAALSGEIKNSTVTAKSGEKWYKDSYTCAMDIGFGVVDPAREGTQTGSKLIYNGVEIGIPAPGRAVSTLADLNKALEDKVDNIILEVDIQTGEAFNIDYDVTINGNGCTISRAAGYTGTVLTVASGATVTIENLVLDGAGATATGNLIATQGNGSIVLNEGTVLQNNNGAHAVSLATRGGGSLTLNGASIINNSSDSGAIWGGGAIIVNEGSKINNNSSTGIAGAIRMVGSCNLTMNGGEISNNTATGDGGAIWGYGSSTYNFNGGKMNGNTSAGIGGAIYTGTYSVINISGDFELCNNTAANSGAIRLTDHTSMTITGGKISGNTQNGDSNAFNTWNNTISITAGELEDNMSYVGGLTLTIGEADIDGVIAYDLSTNHNTAYLAEKFNSFKFTVDETNANFANFNFKPAAGYTYTAGDEAKLICMNEGYETYWDAATGTFRLQAN
ncbi:MAG: hypothetical protein IJZ24_00425 [Clostridia bacterium]|nr:hypothetical protein [Clostridia bacterium]